MPPVGGSSRAGRKSKNHGLNKKLKVKSGDNQLFLTRAELGIDQLNQFAKGDRHARKDLMDIAAKFGVDLLAGQRGKSRMLYRIVIKLSSMTMSRVNRVPPQQTKRG